MYKKWKYERYPHLSEVIEEFSSLKLNAHSLISQLPKLQPRYYSVSSTPKSSSKQIDLTAQVVEYMPNSGKQTKHYGVCSKWLDELMPTETVHAFIKRYKYFLFQYYFLPIFSLF